MTTSWESILSGDNADYIEQMRLRYCDNPQSVNAEWQQYFADNNDVTTSHQPLIDSIISRANHRQSAQPPAATDVDSNIAYAKKQSQVSALITRYRMLGVRESKINPLEYENVKNSRLDPVLFGLDKQDEDMIFSTDIPNMERASLKEIINHMRSVYCGTLVPEFMHISDDEQRNWLVNRFEQKQADSSKEEKINLLERLNAAEALEKYLHTRYIGQKRFSLEGGDSLIPLIDTLLTVAGDDGIVETVIGMAHRGRLNVLVNVLGKQPSELFMEFEGKHAIKRGSGDVKYHMGFSSTLKTSTGAMHLAMAFNPSHLEIVSPVVEGSVRARQDRRDDTNRNQAFSIHIHGDAAFAGQGVVMETLNFSQARGFKTGGSIHVIVNNQIGFTTSTPDDARSTFFCTDIGKMVEIPIIHVNCDDLVGVAFAAKTAFAFKQKFGVCVIIDLVCFRRLGHNEQDEPFMTQPLMYQKIAEHPGSLAVYANQLIQSGVITSDQFNDIKKRYRQSLDEGVSANPLSIPTKKSEFIDWSAYEHANDKWDWTPEKIVPLKTLQSLGKKLSTLPPDFEPHANLKRLVNIRREMVEGKRPLDWGMAENLSYATLLADGYRVRLSGQDCGRGTFSHRHAVWHDQKRSKRDGGNYVPLRHLSKKQGNFLVIDSILSEEGVMAFEYGYSTTLPDSLVVWEGQFGDFANGAQVVIDQFIASGETKWGRYCGLTLLLPHGFEGQGPEHSSARLERYLQLCAEYNIQVCVPSTPAQIYHLLRRQVLRNSRTPLIVITPKSLLRNPAAVSTLDNLSEGRFEPVIGEADENNIKPKNVKRLVFCSGKIYYELCAARLAKNQTDVAICRIEQLYPFPHNLVAKQITKYKNAQTVVWCQEEPGNQGAWHRIVHYLNRHLRQGQKLTYALRASAASPAAGFADVHKREQQEVIDAALDINSIV